MVIWVSVMLKNHFVRKRPQKVKVQQIVGKHPKPQLIDLFVRKSLSASQKFKPEGFKWLGKVETQILRKVVTVRYGKMSKPTLFNPNSVGDLHSKEHRSCDIQTPPWVCPGSSSILFPICSIGRKCQLTEFLIRQKFENCITVKPRFDCVSRFYYSLGTKSINSELVSLAEGELSIISVKTDTNFRNREKKHYGCLARFVNFNYKTYQFWVIFPILKEFSSNFVQMRWIYFSDNLTVCYFAWWERVTYLWVSRCF